MSEHSLPCPAIQSSLVMRCVHPGEGHRVEAVEKLAIVNAARGRLPNSKRRKRPPWKVPLQFPLRSKKKRRFLKTQKAPLTLTKPTKRRRSDSNRCIKVLQTSPLPLGYGAVYAKHFIITEQGREISG